MITLWFEKKNNIIDLIKNDQDYSQLYTIQINYSVMKLS